MPSLYERQLKKAVSIFKKSLKDDMASRITMKDTYTYEEPTEVGEGEGPDGEDTVFIHYEFAHVHDEVEDMPHVGRLRSELTRSEEDEISEFVCEADKDFEYHNYIWTGNRMFCVMFDPGTVDAVASGQWVPDVQDFLG